MKKYILILLVFLPFFCSFSQTNDLSESDIQEFHERTGQMIESFQNKLSILGSKGKSYEVKKTYLKQTLELFIGRGDSYEDVYGNSKQAVQMEVSMLRNGNESKRNIPVKAYVNNLIILLFAKVELTQAETFQLSEMYKVGDHYEATATIFQKFVGYCNREGRLRPCYQDITKKTIKIYVLPESDYYGTHWTVKFGDISVAETTN